LIRIAFQETDDHFLTNARYRHTAPFGVRSLRTAVE
jgi:hypothetical protein